MKEFIEIPFGAKDSELGGWEYNIPEGYTASIESGKIIVKKEESEDEKIRKDCIKYLDWEYQHCSINEDKTKIEKCIAWLEKQGEQKHAWSEDDELHLEDAIHAAKELYSPNCGGDELVDWLKTLKDRVQPQNLTITDEELAQAKKEAYNDALDKIEYHSGVPSFDDGWSAAIWYIKKKNIGFKNTWKPSEEQIQALDEVYKTHGANNVCRRIIFNLLEQLKKL